MKSYGLLYGHPGGLSYSHPDFYGSTPSIVDHYPATEYRFTIQIQGENLLYKTNLINELLE